MILCRPPAGADIHIFAGPEPRAEHSAETAGGILAKVLWHSSDHFPRKPFNGVPDPMRTGRVNRG
eukprot:scaffold7755_cov248-Pinguiococcus_pyrenoidosus.AAC.1